MGMAWRWSSLLTRLPLQSQQPFDGLVKCNHWRISYAILDLRYKIWKAKECLNIFPTSRNARAEADIVDALTVRLPILCTGSYCKKSRIAGDVQLAFDHCLVLAKKGHGSAWDDTQLQPLSPLSVPLRRQIAMTNRAAET
ncbi:Hypothetical predicted protein [Olea europaea subsp. europaea]|uniref:Uncharacterized protein n=1 Tax=Olea europaea subsp. europaea TaxID=158383 RepID=A0A8S0U046_OLEEU|nr:Hypothetical predicted protein [Olea europaea subsp. europaea]